MDLRRAMVGDPRTWSLTDLVDGIEIGDRRAWPELVARLTPTVGAALRNFDVDDELRADAAGEVWRLLFERLGTVNDPECIHGWIWVVATNQIRSILRRASHRREVATVDEVVEAMSPIVEADRLAEDEVHRALHRAVSKLSPREQTVIRCRALTADPEPLESMEARYGIPAGSIGPTLGRGLKKLRRDPQLIGLLS